MVLFCVSGDSFGRSTLRRSGSSLGSFITTLSVCFGTCIVRIITLLPLSMIGSLLCDIHAVLWSLFLMFWTPVLSFFVTFNWLGFFSMRQRGRSRVPGTIPSQEAMSPPLPPPVVCGAFCFISIILSESSIYFVVSAMIAASFGSGLQKYFPIFRHCLF